MADQPVAMRQVQESLDVLQSAMNDGFAMQDAAFQNLLAQVKSIDAGLDGLRVNTDSILNVLRERIDRLDEGVSRMNERIDGFSRMIDIQINVDKDILGALEVIKTKLEETDEALKRLSSRS